MNYTIWLDNILLESYPLITNARLNVTITHIIDTDGHKGYAQTCDSDWDYHPQKELEFEPEFGETGLGYTNQTILHKCLLAEEKEDENYS